MARQLPLEIRLREDATFASYIGSAGERMLAADEVVGLVVGLPGTGKSHLLQAACHHARQQNRRSVFLELSPDLTPDILVGIGEQFDLVAIDQVEQVLGGHEAAVEWEVALFHLINSMKDRGHQLWIAFNTVPGEEQVALADLRSRLLGAAIVETDRLRDDEMLQLLQEKAVRQGFDLSDEVARFILNRTDRRPRALVDLLHAIEVATLSRQRRVTIPLVKAVLAQ